VFGGGGGGEKEIKSLKWSAARVSQINKLVIKGPFSVVKNSWSWQFGASFKIAAQWKQRTKILRVTDGP